MISARRAATILIAALLCPGGVLAKERGEGILPRVRPGLDRAASLRFQEGPVAGASTRAAAGDSLASWSGPRERPRPTHAASGVKVGAIVGGVGGAAFGVMLGLLAEGLCEGFDCEKISAPGWVGLVVFGGGVGAGAGALIGGIVGGSLPAEERGSAQPPEPEPPQPAASSGENSPSMPVVPVHPGRTPQYIASFTVRPGAGILTGRPGHESAFMLRASLVAQFTPWFAMGPEVSRSELARGFTAVEGVIQLGPSRHVVYPYVIADLGLHSWDTGPHDINVSVLGAGIGGGVAWAPGAGRWRVGAESRYQWTPQNIEDREGYRFVFVGGSARVSW